MTKVISEGKSKQQVIRESMFVCPRTKIFVRYRELYGHNKKFVEILLRVIIHYLKQHASEQFLCIMLCHFICFQNKCSLLYIPYVKVIIITHHGNFLMKLGLKARDIFEGIDIESNSSTMWRYQEERIEGKDQ